MFGRAVRNTFKGYAHASKVIDAGWGSAILVFQAGIPRTRGNSITGGGQIPFDVPEAFSRPVIQTYAPGVTSYVGGGQMPALTPEILALMGGAAGRGN